MKKIIKVLSAFICSGLILINTVIPSVSAEETDDSFTFPSGMTYEDFQFVMDFLENDILDESEKWGATAVGVFLGDEVLYEDYFSVTDSETQAVTDENAVFEWGDISQIFVWVSAMQLWEQGNLDLERDVRDYLPDDFFQNLSYDEPITMLNLMNHNAGWQDTMHPIWKKDGNGILSLKEELQAAEPAQVYPPGEVTARSYYGAAVAGYVIECITGQDYYDYVHEHILEPLGMEHTSVNASHTDNKWVNQQRRRMKSFAATSTYLVDKGYSLNYLSLYPAGAATGTMSDLMTFAQALMDEGSPLFQFPETHKEMFSGTLFFGESDIPMCAHGLWCEESTSRIYGCRGETTSSQGIMLLDPESKIGLVDIANQTGDGNNFLQDVPECIFGRLSPEKYTEHTDPKTEFSGYYLPARSPQKGMMKLFTYLSAFRPQKLGEFESVRNGVYQEIYNDDEIYPRTSFLNVLSGTGYKGEGDASTLWSYRTYTDGVTALSSSSDRWKDNCVLEGNYVAGFCLFVVYLLASAAALYLIRIRFKLRKCGKLKSYSGSSLIRSGQSAWLVSVLIMIAAFIIYSNSHDSLPYIVSVIIGLLQMVCMVLCGAAAVRAVAAIARHNDRVYGYVANIVCNIAVISAIAYFEMYRFWGI